MQFEVKYYMHVDLLTEWESYTLSKSTLTKLILLPYRALYRLYFYKIIAHITNCYL